MASSNQNTWSDFDALRHSVKSHTVDRLKQLIQGLSEECHANISKTGKKQDLIDRIVNELDRYRFGHLADTWNKARAVLYQVKNTGSYSGAGTSMAASYVHANPHTSSYSTPKPIHNGLPLAGSSSGTSSIGRFDPYAPPRRPVPGPSTTSPSKISGLPNAPIRFKPSPFFRVDQAVSLVQECPESSGNADRKTSCLQFTLNPDHVSKLSQPDSNYQLRLYCTTSTFYTPPHASFRTIKEPCPIEFPATCEVRINNVVLTANLKGIKKKPGTAPPADLGDRVRRIAGSQNRIDIVYVNSSQGQPAPPPKKYYLVVMLVEVTSVDQLVERLRKGKHKSHDEIKNQMAKLASDDDEIVFGKQKMSLKCPLSYTRIKTPSRSEACVHPQCFEAVSWYSVMEQTTTWLCPVCDKILNPEDLIVDGFVSEILSKTPESVEEVEVEADGEWHTEDNKYGSADWLVKHPPSPKGAKAKGVIDSGQQSDNLRTKLMVMRRDSSYASVSSSHNIANGVISGDVVVLDDSDGEDEGRVKKEVSPMDHHANGVLRNGSTSRTASAVSTSEAVKSLVIDLTLDSDDDNPPPSSFKRVGKRKAEDAPIGRLEETVKRPRQEVTLPLTVSRDSSGHLNGGRPPSSKDPSPNPSSWNGNPRPSGPPSSSSYSVHQRPLPRLDSMDRLPPASHYRSTTDSYRPRASNDSYPFSNAAYRQVTNGNLSSGPRYNSPPGGNDSRRLPLPASYGSSNPYLPRMSGADAPRWP